MAKVKKAESKLQQGKPATAKQAVKVTPQATKQGKPAGINEVVAVKNGRERTFTRQMWDHLPANKEGWNEIVEAPKAPAIKKQTISSSYEDAVKEYTELFGEAPGQDLSLDDLTAAIATRKGDQNNG